MKKNKLTLSRSLQANILNRQHCAIRSAIESLETRLLFAAISSNAVTGDWSATSTWVGGVVPGSNDHVTIVAGAHISVSQDEQLITLTTQAGSDLSITANSTATGTLQLLDGVAGSAGTIAGSLELGLGANINNDSAATLTLSGASTLTGDIEGAGGYVNSGTMTLTGGGIYGGFLHNDGTIITSTGGYSLAAGGILTNDTAGVFNITNDTGPAPGTYPVVQGGNFINQGTLNKTGGTGIYNFPDYAADETFNSDLFENAGGTVNI